MIKVNTYPEMNAIIKKLLRDSEDNMLLYAAARIEELEQNLSNLISVEDAAKLSMPSVKDTAELKIPNVKNAAKSAYMKKQQKKKKD